MAETPESLRRALADSAEVSAKVTRAGAGIAAAAGERRDTVSGEMGELAGKAIADPDAADRYLELTAERGLLDQVIGRGG